MPSCIVKGCTHYTGMKASNPLLTMHVFPRELSRIKVWLQQIGQNFGDLDSFAAKVFGEARTGKYRICSAHFAPGSYTAQGSRIVLKHDAIPTLFPGIYPQPPPDWKPQPSQEKKPDATGKSDNTDTSAPKPAPAITQKKEVGPQASVDLHKRLQEGVRRNQGAKQSRTLGPLPDKLLNTNGRNTGAARKDMKTKADELSHNATQPVDTADENRRALWSLENVMVSLLQHLSDAPLSSRAQKAKTGRLLNQTAEIVSVLTKEEWTVVKKNSHISKFYNMIREVPIKCGDVAVFFSMDEWDYIEDHEEHYKHVMVEEPKNLPFNGSSGDIDFGGPLDFLPSPTTLPPMTDKEEITREDLQVLEMSCSSDDDIDEPVADTPPRVKVESPSGDKDVVGHLDVPQSPVSPPAQTDKYKGKRKKDEDKEILEENQPSDNATADPTPETPERRDDSPAADTIEESESSGSELWIAQDGTTSSTWIPQDDPRPKGRNCFKYGKHAGRIQCPVSLSGVTICLPELPVKRAETALELRCDLCDIIFPDKYELELHVLTHSKKQRL
ncbi:uncharacterized protein RB166_011295 isoform 2-T2 [Leptodactylus fuscus]